MESALLLASKEGNIGRIKEILETNEVRINCKNI